MATTAFEPMKQEHNRADTKHLSGDNPAPRQEAGDSAGLRWWRADPEDWMRRAAWRRRLTVPGAFDDVG